jgi:tight adherence protein C
MLMSSDTRIKLSNAGFNKTNSIPIFYASKSLSFLIFPFLTLIASILFNKNIQWEILYLTLLMTAAIGYYLPNALLEFLIRRRQRELFLVFPDALDLLRVCVEAGLGLDAAIERVGREIRIESVALSNEFSLLDLELRAGSSRSTSLKNLATRIGIEDIDSLVSMLIQADRFGTSIVESLKVYSHTLRTKRRLLAEEKAAKLPVKILLPLIFCIFPSLLTVLLGPAVINIARVLGPRISGN